jgi:hypothetical protein
MTELEMLRLANEGHVRMIADLAAERDALKASRASLLEMHWAASVGAFAALNCYECGTSWPCDTARALGVSDD